MPANSADDEYVFRIGVAILDGGLILVNTIMLAGLAALFLAVIEALP